MNVLKVATTVPEHSVVWTQLEVLYVSVEKDLNLPMTDWIVWVCTLVLVWASAHVVHTKFES